MGDASLMVLIVFPLALLGGIYGSTWFLPWWWGKVSGNPIAMDRVRLRGIAIGYGLFALSLAVVFGTDAITGQSQ